VSVKRTCSQERASGSIEIERLARRHARGTTRRQRERESRTRRTLPKERLLGWWGGGRADGDGDRYDSAAVEGASDKEVDRAR